MGFVDGVWGMAAQKVRFSLKLLWKRLFDTWKWFKNHKRGGGRGAAFKMSANGTGNTNDPKKVLSE